MDPVTIRTFDNYFSANILLTRLQAAGLECYLKDDYTVTIDPILTNAIGGIKLVVKRTDLQLANDLLVQFEEAYRASMECPNCGAHDISRIPTPGVATFLTAILTWVFSSYAIVTQYIYHCDNCGYESKNIPHESFDSGD